MSTGAGRAPVSVGQGTYRETDAFRELVSSTAPVGGADWCRTLVDCVADLSSVPDTAVILRGTSGVLAGVAASDPGLLRHVSRMAAEGWAPFVDCTASLRPLSVDPGAPATGMTGSWAAGVFAALHLFPVTHRDEAHGVVVLCDRIPNRLGAREAAAVTFVASAAGLILGHEQEVAAARRLAAQLQQALESRVVVEQAKGFLAGRDGHDLATAFASLRERARRERRPLADVARETLPGP